MFKREASYTSRQTVHFNAEMGREKTKQAQDRIQKAETQKREARIARAAKKVNQATPSFWRAREEINKAVQKGKNNASIKLVTFFKLPGGIETPITYKNNLGISTLLVVTYWENIRARAKNLHHLIQQLETEGFSVTLIPPHLSDSGTPSDGEIFISW